MAAVTPIQSFLHSSTNAKSSNLLNTRLSSAKFGSTQLKFQSNSVKSLSLKSGGKTEYKCGDCYDHNSSGIKRGRGRGCVAVRCTAEGIERRIAVGGRGQEGNFAMPERFMVVALMACCMCLCNADRVVMSVAIVPLAAKHGWSSSFLGIVQVPYLSFKSLCVSLCVCVLEYFSIWYDTRQE